MGTAADGFGFVVGEDDGGGGVGWDGDGEAAGGLLPVGDDGAVGRVVLDVESGERGAEGERAYRDFRHADKVSAF